MHADALLSACPQLIGRLVHLDRLLFVWPVPRVVGLRPVLSSRSLPCVDNPDRATRRPRRGCVIQPDASPSGASLLMPLSIPALATVAPSKGSSLRQRTPLSRRLWVLLLLQQSRRRDRQEEGQCVGGRDL
jgi:hypothetical protein